MANYNRSDFLLESIIKIIQSKQQKQNNSYTSAYPTANTVTKQKKHYQYSFFKDLIVTSIFWIIGIIFLISGYSRTMDAEKIISQGNKTMASITNVHEYEVANADGGYSDERDVSLSYIANGQKYDCIIKEANIYESVGEKTEIYYDSNDPTLIISSEHLNSKISFLIPMGIALCVFALFLHIASWLIAKKKNLN